VPRPSLAGLRGNGTRYARLAVAEARARKLHGRSILAVSQREQTEAVVSLIDEFHQAKAKLAARSAEPWRLPLERVHGKIGDDGVERITTQLLFDILEVPQRSRGAGACRRLAKLMAELGWMAVRVRGLTRGGYLEQVRGYCREPFRHS
jgi:hypothetical protein